MFGTNPYMPTSYNPQMTVDKINNQINELERLKSQIPQNNLQQPTNLTQNFQLAPTNNHTMRYANTIEDVNRENVYFDTPFFSKDMSVLWIKNVKGNIKTYELNEIVPKDEKDLQIEYLQSQIYELKGMINNDADVTNVASKQNATNTAGDDEQIGTTVEKTKSTSIQKVSRSKKK